jgi:plastocyanin
MRKSFFLLVAFALLPVRLTATQHIVANAGLTFSPSTLTIAAGDTVVFSLPLLHDALEVDQSTWNANGSTALPGGFAVPFGGGMAVLNDTGTHYYICEAHILFGMKGTIIVTALPPPTTTVTVSSTADQDGLVATGADRISKNWSLGLYKDSVGSGVLLGSVSSGTSLSVPGLPAGTYVAAEADSASWSHVSVVVDGVDQGPTSLKTWSLTVPAGGTHTVEFLNTAPNMIISSGLTFKPDTLTVDAGDTVFFVLSSGHSPREVSKATWLANGTASNGGFDLPAGGGSYIAAAGGADYYVCVAHAGSGSKGLIFVNPVPPSTITLSSTADQDGNSATAGDRIRKAWSMKLYKDSVGSGIVVDSTNTGDSLVVAGLPPGVYVAAEADSAAWMHVSLVVDGAPQGATAQSSRAFSVGSGEARSIEFINHAPNMIISSGLAFVPETLRVDSGATVRFVLDPMHTARQVDSATWAANGTTSNGGFDLPFGGGAVTMTTPGNIFYVCVTHAASGMKGIVRVIVEPTAGSLSDSVADGWNLLSLPYAIADSSVPGLYPGASSGAYLYTTGYSAVSSLSNGPGYWIKFAGNQVITLSGLLVVADTIPVQRGWNIVGSLSHPVAAASILSIPPGLVTSPFYGYGGGYSTADTIRPGFGYWVKAGAAGSLILQASPSAGAAASRIRIVPVGEVPPATTEDR